jgi:hypothetical protein
MKHHICLPAFLPAPHYRIHRTVVENKKLLSRQPSGSFSSFREEERNKVGKASGARDLRRIFYLTLVFFFSVGLKKAHVLLLG